MKETAVSVKGYLKEAEEQLELLPWFDLVIGAESSLREKRKTQERSEHDMKKQESQNGTESEFKSVAWTLQRNTDTFMG